MEEVESCFGRTREIGDKSFKDFLNEKYPEYYKSLLRRDNQDNLVSVIEVKRLGVILTSLEDSAHADSLAVLRVRDIDRADRLKIILNALSHLGKSYDFDFDFTTDNYLVCSELIYKSYLGIEKLNIEPVELNARLMFSPNQFAEKFANEFDSKRGELHLVLFLDGNEKTRKAIEKKSEAFKETWKRPKWHIAKDYIGD